MMNNDIEKEVMASVMDDLVQLARLSLTGRPQDIQLYVRRLARRHHESAPALSKALENLLVQSPTWSLRFWGFCFMISSYAYNSTLRPLSVVPGVIQVVFRGGGRRSLLR